MLPSLLVLGLPAVVSAVPAVVTSFDPAAPSGDITIVSPAFYPENADTDVKRGVTYFRYILL